jgi:hypothetical protein
MEKQISAETGGTADKKQRDFIFKPRSYAAKLFKSENTTEIARDGHFDWSC